MNVNKKIILLNLASLVIALAPLDAATRSGKRYHEGSTQLEHETTANQGAPKRAVVEHAEVVVEVCETTFLAQLEEDFASDTEAAAPLQQEKTRGEIIAQSIADGLTRRDEELLEETKAQMDRDAAIVSAAIVHDIAPVPFGPKTLKKTIKANTRKARLLLEETYAHHSKANAKVNLRVHDLLFVVPAPTHNIFGKAARRSIATISWLAGKPTALQQAIKIDDLVGVFKLFITSPEEFYAEVNTQGIEDMTELGATHTMENMVNALFGSLETIFANNK